MSHATLLVALDGVSPTDEHDEEKLQELLSYQLAPFDEEGEWFGEGTRWDWWVVGGRFSGKYGEDVFRRSSINLEELQEIHKQRLIEVYEHAQQIGVDQREFIYGVRPDEAAVQYLERKLTTTGFSAPYSYLRNRVWHERERLGWFGMSAQTECEVNGNPDTRICTFENKQAGSRIVSWKNYEAWDRLFYPRFIEPLAPDTLLVLVDYHV